MRNTSHRYIPPADVAQVLQVEVAEVERWIDALELLAIQLPNGERRVDAQSLRDFLRARVVGFVPR